MKQTKRDPVLAAVKRLATALRADRGNWTGQIADDFSSISAIRLGAADEHAKHMRARIRLQQRAREVQRGAK